MDSQINYKIFPLGETAMIVEFGSLISIEINDKVRSLAEAIEKYPFAGFTECVPAYSSLTIFYDLCLARESFDQTATVSSAITSYITDKIENLSGPTIRVSQKIEVPVDFDKNAALDLKFVAELNELSTEEVIEIFLSRTYHVFMIGFLPGFAYMGKVSESIAAPRKPVPRALVPKGSIGIAATQTGIYPNDSPGGWQIIGRTDLELFTPYKNKPTLLTAGDKVKFVIK